MKLADWLLKSSMTRKSAIRDPQSAILLLLIPLLYFYPVLLGQVVLAPGDGWAQNFGVRGLIGQLIRDGHLPIWNPYIFAGMPLMASIYGGAFYPPNWLFAVLPPGLAMNVVVITTYHLALIGTYLYARRIGIERLGALLAGIAFTFGGFMINHLAQTSRIAAAAWLPWVLLAIENLARGENAWKWTALGALFIALQFLAGEPQMMVFTVLVSAPCAIHGLMQCETRAARLRFLFSLVVMLGCGALFCLPELLPARELLAQSERSDPGPLFFDTFSLPPWQLPALIFPYFFGGAMFPPYRVPYWGKEIPVIMSGYVGMLTWLLALAAILTRKSERPVFEVSGTEIATTIESRDDRARIRLWLGIAIVSLLLAFGGYLPFELNHLLYRVPGYSAFRGLYRHQFEFTFAMAMLAGFGMNRIAGSSSRSALRRGTVAMLGLVALVVILYRFFGDRLATVKPMPANATSFGNPEFLIPLALFLLSLAALWFVRISNPKSQISNLKSRIAYLLLAAILLLDVASYGHSFHFPIAKFDVKERLADPPAVQLIKSREKDLNSFRVMSQPMQAYDYAYDWPEDPNFEAINQPNISILRGLQSVSGYDILRPVRFGEIAGSAGSALNGFVQDYKSFGLEDRGLDLLNVKYLIVGHGGSTKGRRGFTYDGVYFARTNFAVEFKPGVNLTTDAGGAAATEIAIVSTLTNSTHLPDGAPVLKLRLHSRDGKVIERELQAGRDTSEWAYERADVRAGIKHSRARVVENRPDDGFLVNHYLGRLQFDRAEIEKIEWIYAREDASFYLIRASLHDSLTGESTPLAAFSFPSERWRRLDRIHQMRQMGQMEQIEVYENLRAMPRAWFAGSVVAQSAADVLKTIRTGVLANGEPFDPARTALVETEDRIDVGQDAILSHQPKIELYEANRIKLTTETPRNGFLVLSEIYYDGWEARIDGEPAKIHRTNYTLRGVAVPAGRREIEFVYRPQTLRQGAMGGAIGLILLMISYPIMRSFAGRETRSLN